MTALSQPDRQGVTVRTSTTDGTTEFYVRAGTSAPLILAAPKRVKCLSCGELYQARAEIPKAPPTPAQLPPSTPAGEVESATAGPLRTLVLKRSFAFGPCVAALVQVRPDLTPAQAKQMLKDSKNGPQVLLADRPQIVVDMAVALLKKAGVDTEIV